MATTAKCGVDDWFASGKTVPDLEACIVDTLPGSEMEWELPIPFNDPTGPPFPLDALPDTPDTPLRSLVVATATQVQAPADMAAWCALATIGGAVRGRLDVQARPDWREPVHIQSLQSLQSGGGKGPTYKVFAKPLYLCDKKERALWEAEHKVWEMEKRLRELNERKAKNKAQTVKATGDDERRWQSYMKALVDWEEKEPKRRRIVASNTTAEALERRVYEQGGAMMAASPEGGFLSNVTGGYGDTPKSGVLLHGYSGEPYENDRITDDQQWRVERSCVAVSLAIQPCVLVAMGKVPGFQDLGVAARFLVTCPPPITWQDLTPPAIPDELKDWWNRRIVEIADGTEGAAASPVPMVLSPAALQLFEEERVWWRLATWQGVFADMPEWGRKYSGNVLRIAGLLHVLQEDTPQSVAISRDSLSRSIVIMRNAIDHARVAHGILHGMGEQGPEQEVLNAVVKIFDELQPSGDYITSGDVYDRLRGRHAFRTSDRVIAALRVIEEHRYIRLMRKEGPGPLTFFIFLNPQYTPAKM